MKGAFAGRVNIRVSGLHRKQLAAILEHEPESRNNNATSHAAIVALDKADHVAFIIGGAHVNRVAIFQGGIARRGFLRGAFRIDQLPAFGGVRFRKQACQRNLREFRIGVEFRAIRPR